MTTASDIDPPELGEDEPEAFEELPAEDPEHAGPTESGPVDLVPIQRLAQGPRIRARTLSMKRLSKRDLERDRLRYPTPAWAQRPVTRADCETCPTCQAWRDAQRDQLGRPERDPHDSRDWQHVREDDPVRLACGHTTYEAVVRSRPCLYVSCKYALYLDAGEESGSIKLNHPHLEPEEMGASCVLDLADRGELTLESVGGIMALTRERVRQYETRSLASLKELSEMAALQDCLDDAPAPQPVRAPHVVVAPALTPRSTLAPPVPGSLPDRLLALLRRSAGGTLAELAETLGGETSSIAGALLHLVGQGHAYTTGVAPQRYHAAKQEVSRG